MSTGNAEWLVAEWITHFADVMQTMADAKPQMKSAPVSELPAGELLSWKQPFSCSLHPLWLAAPESAWTAVGEAVLSSAGVENPPSAEIRSTWIEILQQAMSGVAQAIGDRISVEVTCADGVEAFIEPSKSQVFEIEAVLADSAPFTLYLVVSEKFASSISVQAEVPVVVEKETSPKAAQYEHAVNVTGSRTFELLLDVELPVSVSFGRATLKINEAMNLVSGSLIELDRALNDPVELLVNNCVIARGEVVVVEGNYGIRLTEIVSQKERLQQGRRHLLA